MAIVLLIIYNILTIEFSFFSPIALGELWYHALTFVLFEDPVLVMLSLFLLLTIFIIVLYISLFLKKSIFKTVMNWILFTVCLIDIFICFLFGRVDQESIIIAILDVLLAVLTLASIYLDKKQAKPLCQTEADQSD